MPRQDGESARRPPHLVFMPIFTNPPKDSKRSENRTIVARYAMINRPKPALNSHIPPGSSASSSSNRLNSRDRAPADSTAPEPPAPFPLTPESLPSSTPRLIQKDSGYGAPPLSFISKSTADYYSLPAEENNLDSRTQEENRRVQAKAAEARQRHQTKLKVNRRRLQEPSATVIQSFDNDGSGAAINSVDYGSWEMHEQALAQSNPVTIFPAVKDPFDCLPVKHDPHTQELLYLYLNAQFLSPAFTQGSIEIPQRVKTYRQQTWFPLILESKATLNALVAYIESTPDLPVKSRSSDFLINHVQAAYEGMRYALSNPKTEIDDSICVAVILLMLTAQRLGDTVTFRAHATGLMHLLTARSKAFRNNKLLRDRETQRWQGLNIKVNGPPNPDPCKYCQDAHLRPSRSTSPDSPASSPPAIPSDDSSPHASHHSASIDAKLVPSQPRGAGFYDLIARGFLSARMSGFVEQILIWSSLAEQARRDKLSAAAAATHAWVDERPGRIPPLDTACQFSVRLCLYLSSWLEGGHSCSIVRRMAMATYMSLLNPTINISTLLEECPHVLLWLSYIAGPFAEDDMARQWFMCLLVRARHAVDPLGAWDVDNLLEHVSNLFLWTNTMTPGVRRFSDENPWDVGTAAVWMESPF